MTKNEFINKIKSELLEYPESEVDKGLNFYLESIDDRVEDGMDEETAVAELGDIQTIIQNIQLDMPMPVIAKAKIKESHEKSKSKTLWIILAILGSPFWVPILFALIMVILSVYISIWSVIFALFAAEFAIGISGVCSLFYGFVHIFSFSAPGGIMIIGMSVLLIGLFLLFINPLIWLTKVLLKATVLFLKSIKKLFIKR